jgi:hypothetical protein
MARLVENSRNPAIKQVDTGRLSRRGKGLALTFIAIGLLTFVLPIIKFDPPAHGHEYGSVLDITLRLQATLHPETPLALLLFVPFGLVYSTLLVAIGAVLLIPFRKALLWISLAGLFLLLSPFRGLFGAIRLAASFQSSRHGGDLTTLWVILGIVILAVAGIAWTDTTA